MIAAQGQGCYAASAYTEFISFIPFIAYREDNMDLIITHPQPDDTRLAFATLGHRDQDVIAVVWTGPDLMGNLRRLQPMADDHGCEVWARMPGETPHLVQPGSVRWGELLNRYGIVEDPYGMGR